jgi:hypothetical protein
MPGDYTRFTFDPLRDYSRVRSQQGRVILDADLNEAADGVDHRLRALALDVLGPCTAPIDLDAQPVPAVTGFQIAASGSSFTIGLGRLYLHGLELDNHGSGPPFHIEPGLRDQRGAGPVPYEKQPFYSASSPPPPIPDGRHLAYVDAWEREVTAVEDTSLLDSAIGVDTAARNQLVWRVKVLPDDATGITCTTPDDEIPGWTDATAPSAGRLTTAGVMPPADTNPCSVPPDGGYVGWDNRLYRVEIHDGGTTSTATFKWSRDDASVATQVTDVDSTGTVLTVVSTGRDDVQRIREQAWVEILDDDLELSGTPGFLSTVQSVTTADDGTYHVTLATAIPGSFDPTDPTRRTRLRQWDQTAGVSAEGTLNVAATLNGLVLEDGVEITFSDDPVGGTLKTGDYWTFAARAADGGVQVLTAAPPRGPVHFYGKLAIIDLPNEVVDCRGVWPPPPSCECSGDCTVCVTPQTHASGQLTIQIAVSQVSATGGTVCLAAGSYDLTEPVDVNGAQSVTIHGQGYATVVNYGGDTSAFIVENSAWVTIRDLRVVVLVTGAGVGQQTAMGITVTQSAYVLAESVTVTTAPKAPGAESQAATSAAQAPADAVPGQQGCAIALGGAVYGITVRDCLLMTRVGIARGSAYTSLVIAELEISDCTIAAQVTGIYLDQQDSFYIARVRHCLIVAGSGPGILWHALALTDRNLVVSETYIAGPGPAFDLACSGADVRGCVIDGDPNPGGIALALSALAIAGTLSDVRIQDCRLSADTGVALTGSHQDIQISGCTVLGGSAGIAMANNFTSSGLRVRVRDNDVRVSGTNPVGIALFQVTDAEVRGNAMTGTGAATDGTSSPGLVMIALYACSSATISGNTVTNFVSGNAQDGIGIGVVDHGDTDITGNLVEMLEGTATPAGQVWWSEGINVANISSQPRDEARAPRGARLLDRFRNVTGSSIHEVGGQPVRVTPHAVLPLASFRADPVAALRGNRLECNGSGMAVDIDVTGPVSFNDNNVRHAGSNVGSPGPSYAVSIVADSLAASSNGIVAPAGLGTIYAASYSALVLIKRCAIIGNVTTSPIIVEGNPLPAPWNSLNIVPS